MVEALLLILAFAGVALVLAFRLAIVQAENATLRAEGATDHDIITSLRAQVAQRDA